ncbi:hypothetical protein PISL3812_08447 [Talaromyces islandicus]|uniref:Uncharacterized protein n=1 Tax=Talaromyces islandicus TaxID=28573 RepID=A0A0U1M745_TALIS|nr:hypothetical protein PISL3812_08447 [Talaromyces islandicus]
MLFWYRIAAREKFPMLRGTEGRDDSTANGDGNTTTNFSKDALAIDKFSVHPTAIRVGILNLDAEDEANLRRVLLLRELNRMEQAVHEFMNVDRRSIEESAGESVRRTVKWSLAGIPPLIEELQDVIQTVKQKKQQKV